MKNTQKITIVGAGLVGMSLALALKKSPISITLLEKNLPKITTPETADARPLSLSYGSYRILNALGIWESLAEKATPIKTVHVSEQGKFGMTRFHASECNVPALGYVVPFFALQQALYQAVTHLPNTELTAIEEIKSITMHEDGATIAAKTMTQDLHNQCDLIIGADGTHSTCRQLLRIATTHEDQGDKANIFSLDLSASHQNIAFERFTKLGTLAVLPLFEDKKARLVWTTSPIQYQQKKDWTTDQLLQFVQNCFEGRLAISTLTAAGEFPLTTTIAETQYHKRCLLIGNAAHTIYPLAAQGFNLGLRDVAVLTDVLNEACQQGVCVGKTDILKRYVSAASEHQQAIIQLTNQLSPLFEIALPGAGMARGLGLLSMDLCNTLRTPLARRTMGISGKLPSLMRTSLS